MTAVRILDIYPAQHGTANAYYHHGCRCMDCRLFHRNYQREWRRRNGIHEPGSPTEVNGRVYPSQAAAARALGRGPWVIRYHLDRWGDLSRVGKKPGRVHRMGGRKIPFNFMGRSWLSVSEFARCVGITCSTAHRWIKNGDNARLLAAVMKAEAKQARAA